MLEEAMGSSSDLASRLDFDHGMQFQDEVRRLFKSPVHHPDPSPDGSFLLLVTFRCYLFCLIEALWLLPFNHAWVAVLLIFMLSF